MSGASGADGGAILEKIGIARKQINTVLDGLELDVQQHFRANRIHLPPAPVSLQPAETARRPKRTHADDASEKGTRSKAAALEPSPPSWLRFFNAANMWKDCDQNWPDAEHKEVYEYLFKAALEQKKPLKMWFPRNTIVRPFCKAELSSGCKMKDCPFAHGSVDYCRSYYQYGNKSDHSKGCKFGEDCFNQHWVREEHDQKWQDDDLSLEDWLKLWESPPATTEVQLETEEQEDRAEPK